MVIITAYQFKKTRTIIAGPDGPRENMIEAQYFNELYKENIGRETDYITMLPKQMNSITTAELIDELGKRELNRSVGRSMLNDEKAMSKDILASYAPPILAKLFGKKTGTCPMKMSKVYIQSIISSLKK